MEIPYTTAPRPDTGLTNGTLGVWLFLSSEVMLFGSLFSSYAILRSGAGAWPDQSTLLDVPLASVNTVVLLASSAAIAFARGAVRAGNLARCRLYAALTLAGGLAFLAIKLAEYRDKIAHGLLPSTNNFLGLYYAMTGLHALHLVAGLLVIGYIIGPGVRLWRAEPDRFAGRIGVAAIYWHFVDAVWLCLFAIFYLL
jgi:heme/copper-type cytochrome/quinol oxidase subunit 3